MLERAFSFCIKISRNIDPPYNTGNDFVYDDDFAQCTGEYMAGSGQFDEEGGRLVANLESNGRFHTDWLNMIYPRLKLAKDLLRDDGVIFISIDDNELENLKKICEEIFGYQNFIAQISSLNNPKGRSQDKYVATCHEYLLIFSKTQLVKGSVSIPKTTQEIENDYPLIDKNGFFYRELELRNTHRDFGKFNRPNLYYPIYVGDNGNISLTRINNCHEVLPIWDDGFEGCWTWGKEKASNEIGKLIGKIVSGQWKIYRMAYALQDMEEPMKQVKSIWIEKLFHTEKGQASLNGLFCTKEKYFQSPKSVDYIAQCIQMSQGKDSIFLDFFSGSATTAHAVMQLNAKDGGHRKFIMVQFPEKTDEKSEAYKAGYKNICEIGKERIRRAGRKIMDEAGLLAPVLDIGFRVLKIDSTNLLDVYYNPAEIKQDQIGMFSDNIKPDRTGEDLLFQVMLDLGILLSAKIEEKVIGGRTVFSVADSYMIACFDSDVTTEAVTVIAKMKPYYAVFRDNGLASDSVVTNFEQIFATYSPTTVRKVL